MPCARGEVEAAAAGDAPALARVGGEAVDREPRAAEAAGRLDVGEHGAGGRALDPRAVRLDDAADHAAAASRAADVGADRDRAGQVEQLDPGQPPQRVRRAAA